jgi:16S rRNA G966 N2-methylase RsmD
LKHIDHALVETTRPQAYKAWLYWGKKPPNIVRAYIDNYCPPGGVVLDPFVGSGVTALEAADSARRAIAIDLNPVGLFLAEDLARPLDIDKFDTAVKNLATTLKEIDALYETTQTCSLCKRKFTAPAICYHWTGTKPTLVRVECPKCGHKDGYPPTAAELSVAKKHEATDMAAASGLWAPTLTLGYSPTEPFVKVGGNVSPALKDFYTGRNWFAMAKLRAAIATESNKRLRQAMLAMLATLTHLASSMMMVRTSRPDSSSLARQAYWLPEVFMESNVADLARRALGHHQGYREAQIDANTRFHAMEVFKSVRDMLATARPGIRFICESALDMNRHGADQVPDESVDYIFTDPPYGGAIQYLEMFTLWSAWLGGPGGPTTKMRFADEITVNAQQHKDTHRYNQMMSAAFNECYRVLKPKRWMHVTFHHTDVSTFTSIVEAAQTAGFLLQLVNHQPSLRTSDKALAQPFGSATGNYYLRFFKPAAPSGGAPSRGTVTADVYERLVVNTVTHILAKRGEPTSFTVIMNEIYVDLSAKGVMMTGFRTPAQVLSSSPEFEVVDTPDGKLWWFTDPSSIAGLSTVPLGERVETAVLAVLRRKVRVTFDDVLQEVLINFPNSLTPESGRVLDYLKAYAEHDAQDPGVWRLKAGSEEGAAETEHSRVIAELVEIGQRLGFAASVGKNERPHAWAGGQLGDLEVGNPFAIPSDKGTRAERVEQVDCIWFDKSSARIAFEVENTTTITDGIVRMTNVPGASRRVIVLPLARRPLLEQKLKEPMLNPAGGRSWTYMFYERVAEILADARRGSLTYDGFLDALETEGSLDAKGQSRLDI